MRTIDAEELMWHKSLVEPRDKTVSIGKPTSEDEIYAYRLGWNDAIDTIMVCAPTVDAVEVMRCKDCKHSEYWYRDKRRCFLWNEEGIDVFEDGYCSYGKRRIDDETC